MAYVKATDRIVLANGDVMTLGEAIAAKRVTLEARSHWTRNTDILREVITYCAWEGSEGFPVRKTLYLSRTGQHVSIAQKVSRPDVVE